MEVLETPLNIKPMYLKLVDQIAGISITED